MNYLYGVNWHDQLRKPIRPLTAAAAKRKFGSGPQLSVSAGPALEAGVVPDFTLLVGAEGSSVAAVFYDASGTVTTRYDFSVPDGGDHDRLFLHQVTLWSYPEGDRWFDLMHARATIIVQFRPDGWARRRFAQTGAPQAHVTEYVDVDVSQHWEDRPSFGDWDRFGLRREPALPNEDADGNEDGGNEGDEIQAPSQT